MCTDGSKALARLGLLTRLFAWLRRRSERRSLLRMASKVTTLESAAHIRRRLRELDVA
jgi:hypothetical protein